MQHVALSTTPFLLFSLYVVMKLAYFMLYTHNSDG